MIAIDGIRGDMILSACIRSDLAPIPFTFEATIRATPDIVGSLKEQAVIQVNNTSFRIVKSVPSANVGLSPQGNYPASAIEVSAFPDGLQAIGLPRTSAVIFQNESLAGIYRACGSTLPFVGDFSIDRFSSLVGRIPTFDIARVLQEQSAVVMWRKNRLKAMALRDVIAQTPVDTIAVSSSEDVRSTYLTANQVPNYFSIGPDGEVIAAPRTSAAQSVAYVPRTSARALSAMGKVLIRRKTVTGKVNPSIRAGDVVNIGNTPMIVMTVAQFMKNGNDASAAKQVTKLWLGVLS